MPIFYPPSRDRLDSHAAPPASGGAAGASRNPIALVGLAEPSGDPRRWLALPVLLTGAFLPALDFFIVNVALPSIHAELGADGAQQQFVISAYAAMYAIGLITGGRLGDLFGRRRLFLAGIAGFTLASLLCGLAWSPAALIGGRMLQGGMAALMAPQVLASIRVMFPVAEQSRALGLYTATFGVAATLAQLLGGGLLASHAWGLGWPLIFLVNLPIGLLALLGGWLLLRESTAPTAQTLDLAGVALLSLALALLIYPLVEGRERHWPWWTWLMLAGSALVFVLFFRFERRLALGGRSPLVDTRLFGDADFRVGIVLTVGFYMISAFFLSFPVYLRGALAATTWQAGVATVPLTGGFLLGSLAASRILQWLGPRVLTLSCAAQAAGFLPVALVAAAGFPASACAPGLLVAGVGYGLGLPSLLRIVISGLHHRYAGLASGVVMTVLQIGAALGVAVIGGVFYDALGATPGRADYAHAFAVGMGCNIGLLLLLALLALSLGRRRRDGDATALSTR